MEEYIRYIYIGVSAILTIITSIIALIQGGGKGKVVKCDTLYERMLASMESAEAMYEPIKAKGVEVSAMKKEKVLTDLQLFANANKIKFDIEEWDKEIEKMITFSNSINAKSKEVIY